VLEQIAVQRIERGIVDIRREHAFAEIIEHYDARRPAQPAERFLVQFGPHACGGAKHQKTNTFAAVSKRQHKQPRAPVLPRLRVTHHRASTVIGL
jgi:hypothetical protein